MCFHGTENRTGSIAAWTQSVFGVNIIFSVLQSAAMGGYGATIVNAVVQGVSAALAALVCASAPRSDTA